MWLPDKRVPPDCPGADNQLVKQWWFVLQSTSHKMQEPVNTQYLAAQKFNTSILEYRLIGPKLAGRRSFNGAKLSTNDEKSHKKERDRQEEGKPGSDNLY